MDTKKKNQHKKRQGTKSVREASTRKHDENPDIIGSFTEHHSYHHKDFNGNGLSQQVKTSNNLNQQNDGGDQDLQARFPNFNLGKGQKTYDIQGLGDGTPKSPKKAQQNDKKQRMVDEPPDSARSSSIESRDSFKKIDTAQYYNNVGNYGGRKKQVQSPRGEQQMIDLRKKNQIHLDDIDRSLKPNVSIHTMQTKPTIKNARSNDKSQMMPQQQINRPKLRKISAQEQKPLSIKNDQYHKDQSPSRKNRNNGYDLDDVSEYVRDQTDPYQQVSKVNYLNMMLCHAISVNDELKFMKLMHKLQTLETTNEEDILLKDNLQVLHEKSFIEVRQLCITKTTRESLNSALRLSIETKQEAVAFDLVAFSMEMSFSLTITERQMQLLVKRQMYALIQDLVHGNTLLQIDVQSLDADELFQVQRIQQKNQTRNEHHKETDHGDSQSSCTHVEPAGPSPNDISQKYQTSNITPGMHSQFEGGDQESNTINGTQNQRIRNLNLKKKPFIQDLTRALERNDRFVMSGNLNIGQQIDQDFNFNDYEHPVSFNSKRNDSPNDISDDMQNPDGQGTQRHSMSNEYLTRGRGMNQNNFQRQIIQQPHISDNEEIAHANASNRERIQQTAHQILPSHYNRNQRHQGRTSQASDQHHNRHQGSDQLLLQDRDRNRDHQGLPQQIHQISPQQQLQIQEQVNQVNHASSQQQRANNQSSQRQKINPSKKQEQRVTMQINQKLIGPMQLQSSNNNSAIKTPSNYQEPNRQTRQQDHLADQATNQNQEELEHVESNSSSSQNNLVQKQLTQEEKNKSNLLSVPSADDIFLKKMSMNLPETQKVLDQQLAQPLAPIQEGSDNHDEDNVVEAVKSPLNLQMMQQFKNNLLNFDQNNQGAGGQPQTQQENMKIFSQLQESIKNLVKNNKFIVENNVDKQSDKNKEQQPAADNSKKNLVEKYLKISDFLEYILENQEIFLESQFINVKSLEDQMKILNEFLKNFLMKTQDCIDFDKTVKQLIECKLHTMLINELFEQTDESFKIQNEHEIIMHKKSCEKFVSARFQQIPDNQINLFRRNARLKLLIQLINQSVSMKQYQITYEVTKRFLSDLLKAPNLPIFDTLFNHLSEETSRYEAKIALIFNCIPLMNRNVATRLMKVIEGVLHEPSDNSILKNNINPLRVGLMFYRVIDEIQQTFAYSEHSSNLMKTMLCEQIVKVLDIYNDPEDLLVLVEETDYEGNDCFWYLDEYDLYSLMGCRIMDRVIQKKWNGKYDINASIMDYSTAYTLMKDKYTIFATDWVFQELRHEMFTIDRSDKTHQLKFHVWLESMLLRSQVDSGFSLMLTGYFQLQLNAFNIYFQQAMRLTNQILNAQTIGTISALDFESLKGMQYLALTNSAAYLQYVMYASFINLLFPVNILMEWFFLRQTKRKPSDLDINFLNEMTLFIASLILYIDYMRYYGNRSSLSGNKIIQDDMNNDQVYVANILWEKKEHQYPLEFMLAILAGNCWIKLLLRLRVTKLFGPLFKVIQMMIIDLGIFLVLWVIILIMFSSASCMIFGQLPQFRDFFNALYMYLEYSLGTWDTRIYCEFNKVENAQYLCSVGKIYTTIFLLSNMVLLLNLVIAILSSTFAFYEDKKLGLYYEVLVGKFPSMEYDEKFGAVVCAQPPFNLMILPFWWITLLPWTEQLEKYHWHYNLFLCHLIYLPLGLTFTFFFSVQNICYLPIAYFKHTLVLIQTITDSDETMDEFSEKVTRFFTIIKFIFAAPFILMTAVPIDMVVFFKNLYTMPAEDELGEYKDIITPKSIEILQQSCKEVLHERQEQTKEKGITHVNFVLLNKRLQKNLDVQKQIQRLIFDYNDDNKFITDPQTKTQKLNPAYLNSLREFNLLKRLVANCADKTSMVDTDLLQSLIDQVELRMEMIQTQILLGELELPKDIEDIRQSSLKELARTEPKTVESKLNEDGQVLEVILDQVSGIQQDMGHLKTEIKKSHKLKYDVSNIKSQIEINHQLLVSLMEQQNQLMGTLDSIQKRVEAHETAQNSRTQIQNKQ